MSGSPRWGSVPRRTLAEPVEGSRRARRAAGGMVPSRRRAHLRGADGLRPERGEVEGVGIERCGVTASFSGRVLAVDARVQTFILEQPAHLPSDSVEALDRLGELEVMEPLGKGRAPSAEPQHEPGAGQTSARLAASMAMSGGHMSTPDVEDARTEHDAPCVSVATSARSTPASYPQPSATKNVSYPRASPPMSQVEHDRTPCLSWASVQLHVVDTRHHSMIPDVSARSTEDPMHEQGGPGPSRPAASHRGVGHAKGPVPGGRAATAPGCG